MGQRRLLCRESNLALRLLKYSRRGASRNSRLGAANDNRITEWLRDTLPTNVDANADADADASRTFHSSPASL